MAQIVIRGIDDQAMVRVRALAQREGKSTEQFVRDLIEREAELERAWTRFAREADTIRERLTKQYGRSGIDSTDLIRDDRDR